MRQAFALGRVILLLRGTNPVHSAPPDVQKAERINTKGRRANSWTITCFWDCPPAYRSTPFVQPASRHETAADIHRRSRTYIDDPDRNRSQRSLADVASAEIIRAVDLEDLLQLIVALFKPVMALVRKEVNGVGQLERPLGVAALHLALVIAHAQENRVPANGQAT